MLQGVQQGSIECAQISATIFSNIAPEYDVLNLPFLIDDFEHMERFNDTPECQELLAMLDQYGVKQYRLGNIGFAYPNSKTPVKTVDDFKNVKWRTMSATMQLDTMKALGAVPVTIPYGDVYNALKTGLVDGWHNAGSAFVALSTYEAAAYVTELPLFSWPATFIVSTQAYDKLSDENKQIFDDLFNERLTNGFKVMHDYNMDALDDLLAEGKMELIKLDDYTPFREKIASVYDAYFEANPTFQKYYDAINACR
jgi:TRAP-type C4-dicarboxylate transport system substrate-binding protein